MVKGRKPKQDAQRRGGASPVPVAILAAQTGGTVEPAHVIGSAQLAKPAHIAENPLLSECWDTLVGASPNFEACDAPLLEAYCFWNLVLRQAQANLMCPGGISTTVAKVDEEGFAVAGSASVHPDIRTAERATTMLRQLGDALNLSPTARDRAGLMQAMTKSTQADVVRKTLDEYERFKKQQKALNAAK